MQSINEQESHVICKNMSMYIDSTFKYEWHEKKSSLYIWCDHDSAKPDYFM